MSEILNVCEVCPYASKNMDPIGNIYFTCDIEDNPDYYPGAECCQIDDEDLDLL